MSDGSGAGGAVSERIVIRDERDLPGGEQYELDWARVMGVLMLELLDMLPVEQRGRALSLLDRIVYGAAIGARAGLQISSASLFTEEGANEPR